MRVQASLDLLGHVIDVRFKGQPQAVREKLLLICLLRTRGEGREL
jgi:hypothetical protein